MSKRKLGLLQPPTKSSLEEFEALLFDVDLTPNPNLQLLKPNDLCVAVSTCVDGLERHKVQEAVESMGGLFLNQFSHSAGLTHYVTSRAITGTSRHDPAYIYALDRKLPIVLPAFIHECSHQRKVVDESKFLCQTFTGLVIHVVTGTSSSGWYSAKKLEDIVHQNGGKIGATIDGNTTHVIADKSCCHKFSQHQSNIYIVNPNWVIDSFQRKRCMPEDELKYEVIIGQGKLKRLEKKQRLAATEVTNREWKNNNVDQFKSPHEDAMWLAAVNGKAASFAQTLLETLRKAIDQESMKRNCESSSSSSSSSSNLSSNEWKCSTCTFHNSTSNSKCAMCGVGSASFSSSNYQLPSNKWKCPTCTFHNDISSAKCAVCGIGSTPSCISSNKWKCSTCTFQNSISNTECAMCAMSTPASVVTLISEANLIGKAAALLRLQPCVSAEHRNTVKVRFHWTKSQNVEKISQLGLLTRSEMRSLNCFSNGSGEMFGEGIYVANNPFHFQNYGDICVISLCFHGNVEFRNRHCRREQIAENINTIIGNKKNYGRNNLDTEQNKSSEYVLRSSLQVIPIFQFQKAFLRSDSNKAMIKAWVEYLQKIADGYFNVYPPIQHEGQQRLSQVELSQPQIELSPLPRSQSMLPVRNIPRNSAMFSRSFRSLIQPLPPNPRSLIQPLPPNPPPIMFNHFAGPLGTAQLPLLPVQNNPVFSLPPLPPVQNIPVPFAGTSFASNTAAPSAHEFTTTYTAPEIFDLEIKLPCSYYSSNEMCSICLEEYTGHSDIRVLKCSHKFHYDCISSALKFSKKCPTCRCQLGKVQGKMPSGTMTVKESKNLPCSGYERYDSFVISYQFSGGLQKSYHINPGRRYSSTARTAYIPKNEAGILLLKRLRFAFEHGLTFTIGTSLTSGRQNCITWSSIHHKTSPDGGVRRFGFPDPDYFANVNEELDALNVPKKP